MTKKNLSAYFYTSPIFIFILFVYAFPIVKVFQYSLYNTSGSVDKFIGLRNYFFILTKDPTFWSSLKNNAILLLSIPIMIIISLLLAFLIFDRGIREWRFYQFTVFIPYILSITVIGIFFSYVLRLDGLLNYWLDILHLDFIIRDWLGNSNYALFSIMAIIIWREVGFGCILFLGRLLSIPENLYEAAKIEGASWWQTHIHISIPQLSKIIEFFIVIEAINIFSWIFNYVYVITKGGPGNSTYVMELYIYLTTFRYGMMGIGSTLSVLLFVMILIFVLILLSIRRKEF